VAISWLAPSEFYKKSWKSPQWQEGIDSIVSEFTLNPDQEQAFCIVSNHVADPGAKQLKMYIGGMDGTGKSQVLKALMKFF
jgi:hypothetical protein